MIGLKIRDGDLVITNNEIELVEGKELTRQTIQSVLSTNKGEWKFDTEEGINFYNILGERSVVQQQQQANADGYIQQQYTELRKDYNEWAEMLRKRLDGDL